MMGAPVILYAKSLGASSTVLGIIAAFTPLMNIFQIPAARFLGRITYRKFVLMGWGLRTVFIFFVALVPLMFFLQPADKLAVMLAGLFLFNLLRGISSAAWMPWITSLVPSDIRGRFLSLDQIFVHLGCLLALVASAILMDGEVEDWEYSLVFSLSGIGGVLSLLFIKRIPDIPVGEETRRSAEPVPWKQIMAYPPFLALLIFNVAFMIVIGSLGVFSVEFLREVPHLGIDTILWLSGISFFGGLCTLPFVGLLVDRVGSRPVLFVAVALFGLVILGWFGMASGFLPTSYTLIGVLNFLAGIAGSNFHLANVRISMAIMPEMGRNHFFALFTVISSLGLGAAPVLWGVSLDAIGTFEMVTGAFTWRRHSIYFLAVFLFNFVALALSFRLKEAPQKPGLDNEKVYAQLKRAENVWRR